MVEEGVFGLVGRQAAIVGMGSDGVVEAGNIGQQTLLKLFNGLITASVQFLFFQILEKALHDGVIIGMALGGKRLDHPQSIDFLPEVSGSKLASLIRMEHNAFGDASQSYGIMQSINRQKPVNFASNPTGNDLSGIEIQNSADIVERSANLYIGKIANPYQIRRFLVKSLRKKVLTDVAFFFACYCLGWLNRTHFGQSHLFHQPVHPTFADGNAILPRKTEGHLLCAQPFVGSGVNL